VLISRYFLSPSTKPGTVEQALKFDNLCYCSYMILGEEPKLNYCSFQAFYNE